MTFVKIFNNQRTMLAVGQFSLCFGILLSRYVGGYWLAKLISLESTLDFFQGFVDGITTLLIIVSLVCNLRYLTLDRASKESV